MPSSFSQFAASVSWRAMLFLLFRWIVLCHASIAMMLLSIHLLCYTSIPIKRPTWQLWQPLPTSSSRMKTNISPRRRVVRRTLLLRPMLAALCAPIRDPSPGAVASCPRPCTWILCRRERGVSNRNGQKGNATMPIIVLKTSQNPNPVFSNQTRTNNHYLTSTKSFYWMKPPMNECILYAPKHKTKSRTIAIYLLCVYYIGTCNRLRTWPSQSVGPLFQRKNAFWKQVYSSVVCIIVAERFASSEARGSVDSSLAIWYVYSPVQSSLLNATVGSFILSSFTGT